MEMGTAAVSALGTNQGAIPTTNATIPGAIPAAHQVAWTNTVNAVQKAKADAAPKADATPADKFFSVDSVPQKDGQPLIGPWQWNRRYNPDAVDKYTQEERTKQWEIADPGHWVSDARQQDINGWLAQQSQDENGLTADNVKDALADKSPLLGRTTRLEKGYLLQQTLKSGKLDLAHAEELAKTGPGQLVAEQFAARAIEQSRAGYQRGNSPDIERNTYANLALQALTGDKDKPLTEGDYGAVQYMVNSLGEDGAREFTNELRTGDAPWVADNTPNDHKMMLQDNSPLPQSEAQRRLLTAMIAAPQSPEREAVLQAFQRSPSLDLNQFTAKDGSPLAKTEGQRFALASLVAQDPQMTPEKLRFVQDRGMMANSAYLKDPQHPELGFRDTLPSYIKRVDFNNLENTLPKEDVEKLGKVLDKDFVNKKSGFAASLFYDTRTDTYTLAPRGTDEPKTFLNHFQGDWKNNIEQGADPHRNFPILRSKQYHEDMKGLSKDLKEALGDRLTDITGHSLGGGLGSAGAMLTESRATTFDAAGLNETTINRFNVPWDESRITNYRVRGEPLTYSQEQDPILSLIMPYAAGSQITLEPLNEDGSLVWYNENMRDKLHGTGYFLRGLLIDPNHIDR